MNYRSRLLAYLRDDREDIARRIERFASGMVQLVEKRDGKFQNVTPEALVYLYRQLGEVGALIHETEISADH
jgi:hypothetical protein